MPTSADDKYYRIQATQVLDRIISDQKATGELRSPYLREKEVLEGARLTLAMMTLLQERLTALLEFRKEHPISRETDPVGQEYPTPLEEVHRHLNSASHRIASTLSQWEREADPSNWEYDYDVGDWVKFTSGEYEDMIGQIKSIDHDTDEAEIEVLISPEDVKTIRTAEWLSFELYGDSP